MARTQASDYDQKRDLITTVATKLIAEKGFGSASLADIANAAQSSKSLIYHYFRSKEAILYDIMISHMNDLLSVCDEIARRTVSDEERFCAFARVLLRRYVGAAQSQKILLYEMNNLPDDQQGEIVDKQRQIIKFAEDLLIRARPAAAHDRATLRARIMLFFGMLNWTHTWYRTDGSVSRDAIADMASETVLKSV